MLRRIEAIQGALGTIVASGLGMAFVAGLGMLAG